MLRLVERCITTLLRLSTVKKTTLKRVKRKSVSSQVYEQLKAQVLHRVWLPGTKIPSENLLPHQLGVSRVSVREGLQRLVSLGLLETRHGEGTFVCEYDAGTSMNALLPMLVTLSGMVNVISPEQPLNDQKPMLVTPLPMFTEVMLVQLLNVQVSIVVTPSGMVTEVSPEQP